jgi:hypothetical protein
MLWDAAGKLLEPIKPAYEAFWRETAEVATWFWDGVEPDRGRALELAIRALGINYRVGRAEQNVLRIVDRDSLLLVLAAAVDAPSQGDAPKKSLAPSASPGLPADSPITDLPAATSV